MTQYYVRFTDATGVVISGDTPQSQWFEVSNPAFGSVQMLTIGSQTTGTGAGKVTFTGLNVTLGASALTEKLDLALEAGRSFKTIELVGYDNTSAGLVKTSSTVFKLAGGALDFVDIINGTHTLNFQYGGVVESVATYGQTGQLTGTTTAGWSLINNIRDDSTTFDAHARTDDPIVNGATTSAVVPEASGSHRVFIQLRNFDGTPLSGLGSSWIEVDSAVTSQLQFPNIGSGTSGTTGAGRVAFNPLDVVLKSGSLAPSLDQALALGKPFQVELAVYGDAGGGSDVLLDDYQFGLAGLKESGFANGSRNYSFEYGSERMVHSIYDPNGAYLRSEVEGWDYVRNVKLTAPSGSDTSFDAQKAPAALSGLTNAAPAPEVTQYYVRFTDQNGNVITGDTANGQWFAVSDANYRLEQTLLISPLLPGVGAGKVTFDDLSLSLGTSTLTQAIDHALKAGIAFKTIELVGYNESGKTPLKVSSTVFKLAGASGDSIDPQSGTHTFTFGYGDMVESIRTFDATGAVTGTVTAGWDRVKNVRDDSVTYDAKDRTDDPYLHGAPTDKIVPASSGGHDVYLQIRNFDGSALAGLGKQWIKVDAAIVDQLQTLAISSQTTGIGAGKVTFDPLKLVFDPGSLSPLLDKAMAQGKPFQIELAVYGQNETGSTLLDDYQFGLAAIKNHTFAEGQHTYSFEYGSERTLHNVFDQTGTLVKPVIEGWDRVRNISLTSPSGTDSSFDKQQATQSLGDLTQFANGAHATQYYVRLTDALGNALVGDDGKTQWFEVTDPNYSGEQVLTIGSTTAGTGAGKVTFNPLGFTLAASSLTEKIDQALQAGTPFKTIELVGYNQSGGAPIKVSSSVFKLAGAATDQVDAGTGSHKLTFEYGGLVESQATFDPLGNATGAVTSGWDVVRNAADDTTTFDATEHTSDPFVKGLPTGPIAPSGFSDHHVYLQIRNQNGTALAGLGTQWIEVDAALASQFQTLAINSQTLGIGAGKVTFDPLLLTFNPGALGPKLDQALAQGMPFQIELAVYGPGKAGNVLLDDYQFGLAGLAVSAVAGNAHVYSVEHGSVRSAHSVYGTDGTLIRTDVEGWDRVRNVRLLSPSGSDSSFDLSRAPATEGSISVYGKDTPLTIASEAFSPASTTLHAGGAVSFTLTMSEAVTADGSYLQLSNGAKALFDAAHSTGTTLVYTYVVSKADAASAGLRATALVGTIKTAGNTALAGNSFTAINTTDVVDPNNPAIIGGKLAGKVAVGGIDTVVGKLLVTDADPGEAGIRALSLNGKFGTFAIDAVGVWQYHLTDSAAAAAAKATGGSLTETFHVLSTDGSAAADVVVNVAMPLHPGPLSFTGTDQADTLYGGGDGDMLTGLGGNDVLYGLGGDDTLIGGPGDDKLDGGVGFDTASYANADGSVKVDLGISGPQNTGGGGIDTLVRIENIIGSAFADTLTGNALANHLFGGAGNDILEGGSGADIMEGGADNDSYRVNNVSDVVVEQLNGGTRDTVRSSVSYQLSDNVENMVLIGKNAIDATGNALGNSLIGNASDNTLRGLGGNDNLMGGAGNDTLSGGAGADSLTGGAGKDVFLFDALPIKGAQDSIKDFAVGEDKIELSRASFAAFAGHDANELSDGDISFGTTATIESQHLIYNAAKGALYYDDDGTGAHAAILIGVLVGSPILSAGDFMLV